MRTLRLSLAGAVILALLSGMPSLAQDEVDTPMSTESAVLDFAVPYGSTTQYPMSPEFGEGWILYRDHAFAYTIDAGDPRLDGELWVIRNHVRFDDSRAVVGVGFAGIDGEDGAWRGTSRSYGSPPSVGGSLFQNERFFGQVDLVGEGAYEGLSALLFIVDNGTSFDVEGLVFPGELPPMPEMQEPPAE